MRHLPKAGLFFFLLISAPWLAKAVIIPALELTVLTRESTDIVVGRVVGVQDGGRVTINWSGHPLSAHRQIAEIQIVRSLKGQRKGNAIAFQFARTDIFTGYKDVVANQFGLFFLKEDSGNKLTVTNPYYPFIVASRDTPAIESSDLERVVAEVAHVLVSSTTSRDERMQAIIVLDTLKILKVTEALQRAAELPDSTLRLQAITALLKRNDITRLNIAENVLMHPPSNIEEGLLRNLAFALEGVKDPEAIPALARLITASDVQTRRGAAAALCHIDDPAIVDPLSRALEDGDQKVRYHAVLGLAIITGQSEWGPMVSLYQQDEGRYLTYWREWVKKRK